MARDYYTLGASPYEEDCAQVGSEGYSGRALVECRVYLDQIRRVTKTGLSLTVKGFPHDSGTYHEVVIWYNPDSEAEEEEMLRVEQELPATWDDEARRKLESLLV